MARNEAPSGNRAAGEWALRPDGVVTLVLVAAVLLLIIQGSSFFEQAIVDAATHAAVLGLGCQMGQGGYSGKAMPADHAEQLIKRSPSVAAPRTATRKA